MAYVTGASGDHAALRSFGNPPAKAKGYIPCLFSGTSTGSHLAHWKTHLGTSIYTKFLVDWGTLKYPVGIWLQAGKKNYLCRKVLVYLVYTFIQIFYLKNCISLLYLTTTFLRTDLWYPQHCVCGQGLTAHKVSSKWKAHFLSLPSSVPLPRSQ